MLSSYGKGIVIAIALTGVVATTSCSGQTMRERWQQRMAERRANGGQQQGMQGALARRNQPVALPAGAQVERNIAYGPASEQTMDVYRPANAHDAPVIFMVHGGGWRRGDKEACRAGDDRRHASDLRLGHQRDEIREQPSGDRRPDQDDEQRAPPVGAIVSAHE